jgi:hypothetical protein
VYGQSLQRLKPNLVGAIPISLCVPELTSKLVQYRLLKVGAKECVCLNLTANDCKRYVLQMICDMGKLTKTDLTETYLTANDIKELWVNVN